LRGAHLHSTRLVSTPTTEIEYFEKSLKQDKHM